MSSSADAAHCGTRAARRVALLTALPFALAACEWFTDFKFQPRLESWEPLTDSVPPRGNAQFSVPIHGNPVPGYVISYQALPATIDSFSTLRNPVPLAEASVQEGWRHYAINCQVCHGDTGAGNGPATRYGMVPISLLGPGTVARTDGYLFGMIRNGRGLMPNYNRIEEINRWHVVNYVRALQGRVGGRPPTGPVADPGVTGRALPGPTLTAPTRPAPATVEQLDARREPAGGAAARHDTLPASGDTAVRAARPGADRGRRP